LNKCPKCDLILNDNIVGLCEECFFIEFEKKTGRKAEWIFNEKTNEWEECYRNMDFKK